MLAEVVLGFESPGSAIVAVAVVRNRVVKLLDRNWFMISLQMS
jgi:hypothetical protein